MKAQNYEKSILDDRKKSPSFYQFNLISVIDASLVRMDFETDIVKPVKVESEDYLASYIIDRKQTFAKINIVNYKYFESLVEKYDQLHELNKAFMKQSNDEFFSSIVQSYPKLQVYKKDVIQSISSLISYELFSRLDETIDNNKWDIYWDSTENVLYLENSSLSKECVKYLNDNDRIIKKLKLTFSKYYKYTGEVGFAKWCLPF